MNNFSFPSFLKTITLVFLAILATPAYSTDKHDYIVVFKDSFKGEVDLAKSMLAEKFSSRASKVNFKKTYKKVLPGVVLSLTDSEVKELKKIEFIDYLEKDTLNSISTGWGLDRVNQRNLPLDNNFHRPYQGAGVDIYIVDTGINVNHQEFTGRVGTVVSMVGGGTADCQGHGTHVASIAAGSFVGVASDATIHSVRISNDCGPNGTAYSSDVLAAFDWIAQNAGSTSVINYSYESSAISVKNAMDGMAASHVIVTAAGNDNTNACTSPSEIKPHSALIVAATNSTDARWVGASNGSNYGSCVDLFAPGADIIGANFSSNNTYIDYTGTSMASPFVAGVAAAYLQKYPGASSYEIKEAIIDGASVNKVSGVNGSPNRLIYDEVNQPSAYWQYNGIVYSTWYNSHYNPRPGCTPSQIHLGGKVGPSGNLVKEWECK